MRRPPIVIAWILLFGGAMTAEAQTPEAVGDEFQVSKAGYALYPAVDMDARGDFVVVWQRGYYDIFLEYPSYYLWGRRFASDGSALSNQFPLGAPAEGDPFDLAVAPDGRFVVVWAAGRFYDWFQTLAGQRFHRSGTPDGIAFQIGQKGYISRFSIETDSKGGFMVVWDHRGYEQPYGGMHGQRYASDGTAVGEELVVEGGTRGVLRTPDDEFVVVWESAGLWGQTFGDEATGAPFRFDTDSSFPRSVVEISPLGDFVVISTERHPSSWESIGRRFRGDGTRLGEPFQVTSTYYEPYPSVAMERGGEFVVVWLGRSYRPFAIYGQRFDSSARRVGEPFQVSVSTAGRNGPPTVAADSGRGFVVTWANWNSAGRDRPEIQVLGRRFQPTQPFCAASDTQACLNRGRFQVEVEWEGLAGKTGFGHRVPHGSDEAALFYFFQADNWEMLVKILDGCAINHRFWVFAAATTNLAYVLRVTDTESGEVREYRNPLGRAAEAVTDTSAFATCR